MLDSQWSGCATTCKKQITQYVHSLDVTFAAQPVVHNYRGGVSLLSVLYFGVQALEYTGKTDSGTPFKDCT